MAWFGPYIVVAALVAISIFLASNWFRHQHVAAPEHSGATAVLAGLLWPALLLGIAELALVCCATRWTRSTPTFGIRAYSHR